MILDPWVMQQQKWVMASHKVSSNVRSTTYFAAPTTTTTTTTADAFLKVGDAPPEWKGQNPPLPDHHNNNKTPVAGADHPAGYSAREWLEMNREDLLQRQIDKSRQNIQDLMEERDYPDEAAAKKVAKKKANAPAIANYAWYETMNAIGGAWLKASTSPPDGDAILHVLLVRNGTVVDVVPTTIKRYCHWRTPEYRAGASGGASSWGISLSGGCGGVHGIFDDQLQIGDCIMLQVAPPKDLALMSDESSIAVVSKDTADSSEKTGGPSPPPPHDYFGLIDLTVNLVAAQTKVSAMQMTKPNQFTTVYLDILPDTTLATTTPPSFQVGDQLWPDNPTVDSTIWDEQEESFRQSSRARLTKSRQENLNERIKGLETSLEQLVEVRDVPGKREELFDEIRAKHPVQWNEAAVAIGGAWIKASTMPPNGLIPADYLLVRKGKIVEMLSLTLAKLIPRAYDGITGEFKTNLMSDRSGRPWGVAADLFSVRDAFTTALEPGDCVVLRVGPRMCEGGRLVY